MTYRKPVRPLAIFIALITTFSTVIVVCQTATAQSIAQGEQKNNSWPMFHHDSTFAGYAESPAPTTANVLWNYTLSGGVMCASPAVADDRLFIQSEDNFVYCLNASTGTFVWKFKGEGTMLFTNADYHPNRASAAVADGKVYVGSIDDYMYCLNATSGAVIWKYKTDDDLYSFITISKNKVFTGSADFNIYCFNADTGALVWKYNTGYWPFNPAVADDKVFAGSHDSFFALDANTGAVLWTYTASSVISDSPAIADGRVFFADGGSPQGWATSQIHCLDSNTGRIIWSCDAPPAVFSSPAVAYGRVFVGSWNKNVYCLNPIDGAVIWSFSTNGPVASSAAIADNKLYIGSNDGYIYCLNASSGTGLWNYRIGTEVKSSPAIANGKLYIVSREGVVYCFGGAQPTGGDSQFSQPNYELYMITSGVIIAIMFVSAYVYVRLRKRKE